MATTRLRGIVTFLAGAIVVVGTVGVATDARALGAAARGFWDTFVRTTPVRPNTDDGLHCDDIVEKGWFTEYSSRNCAGAIHTRGDVVMLSHDVDFEAASGSWDVLDFAEFHLGSEAEHRYTFATKGEKCAIVLVVGGNELVIGTGRTKNIAFDATEDARNGRRYREVIWGCNSWSAMSSLVGVVTGWGRIDETLKFAQLDGGSWPGGTKVITCGRQPGKDCPTFTFK